MYKIYNSTSLYIGSTESTFNARLRSHLSLLKKGRHFNYKLAEADRQEELIFEVLEIIEDTELIKNKEMSYILELSPNLNIAKSTDCPMRGRKHSEKTRAKLRGRVPWNKGIPRTDEEKRLMSEVKRQKNALRPPEYWDKLSEWHKENPSRAFLGKKHTEENKAYLRQCRKSKKRIQCIDTGEIFEAQRDIAIKMNLRQGHISEHLQGKRASVSGFKFRYLEENNES